MAGVLAADLLDFFYPPVCTVCGRAGTREQPLCALCAAGLGRLPQPVCPRCRAFVSCAVDGCPAGHRPLPFPVWAAGLFDTHYRRLVHALKFENRRDCGVYLGDLLADRLAAGAPPGAIDWITAVPLHPTRRRERGYNQSLLLAERIGARLGLRVRPRALVRRRNTRSQTQLDFRKRQENVAGAFAASAPVAGENTVLLVDDVLTTGATLRACAQALREGGAGRVWGAVVALADTDS